MKLLDLLQENPDDLIECEYCGEDVERDEAVHNMHSSCYNQAKKEYEQD